MAEPSMILLFQPDVGDWMILSGSTVAVYSYKQSLTRNLTTTLDTGWISLLKRTKPSQTKVTNTRLNYFRNHFRKYPHTIRHQRDEIRLSGGAWQLWQVFFCAIDPVQELVLREHFVLYLEWPAHALSSASRLQRHPKLEKARGRTIS